MPALTAGVLRFKPPPPFSVDSIRTPEPPCPTHAQVPSDATDRLAGHPLQLFYLRFRFADSLLCCFYFIFLEFCTPYLTAFVAPFWLCFSISFYFVVFFFFSWFLSLTTEKCCNKTFTTSSFHNFRAASPLFVLTFSMS